jgi:hypothetical protein
MVASGVAILYTKGDVAVGRHVFNHSFVFLSNIAMVRFGYLHRDEDRNGTDTFHARVYHSLFVDSAVTIAEKFSKELAHVSRRPHMLVLPDSASLMTAWDPRSANWMWYRTAPRYW